MKPAALFNQALQRAVLCFCLLSFALACRKNGEPEIAGPHLRAISFDGIPAENVSIDQAKNEITVLVPPTLTAIDLKPRLTLSDDAKVLSGLTEGESFPASRLCACRENAARRIGIGLKNDASGRVVREYAIVPKTNGALAPNASQTGSLEYVIGSEVTSVSIPFQNLYGGSGSFRVTLTRKGSSDPIELQSTCGSGDVQCSGRMPNRIDVNLYGNLAVVPGEYTVQVQDGAGRVLTVPQTLTVKQGTPSSNVNHLFGYQTVAGTPFQIGGINLFEGSFDVVFRKATGEELRPALSNFSPLGNQVTVTPGPEVTPGYYTLQLRRNGQPETCRRLSVLKNKFQPYVGIIYFAGNTVDMGQGCLRDEPLTPARGQRATIFYSGSDRLATLKLTPVTSPGPPVLIPVTPYDGNEQPPFFTIPPSVPAGRYHLMLQVKDLVTGEWLDSEPLERVVEIR